MLPIHVQKSTKGSWHQFNWKYFKREHKSVLNSHYYTKNANELKILKITIEMHERKA